MNPSSRVPVLIAVKDPAERLVLANILEQGGLDVALADDATETLVLLNRLPPHVLLLDAALREPGTEEVLNRIWSVALARDVSILLIGSDQQELKRLDPDRLGSVFGYLLRPIFAEKLSVSVRAALRQAALTREVNNADARFAELVRAQQDGVVVLDEAGVIQFLNPAAESMFARTQQDLIGQPFGRPLVGEDRYEVELQRAEGPKLTVEMLVAPIVWNGVAGRVATLRDVSERQARERALRRLNRLYRQQRDAGRAIVNASTREQLYQAMCDVAIKDDTAKIVAILELNEATGHARPVAVAGPDEGYLTSIVIDPADPVYGSATVGTALNTATVNVCNDFLTDPRMAPWLGWALPRGIRSAASFPIRARGRVIGVMVINSEQPQRFQSDEIELLASLADEFSVALSAIEERELRRAAEVRLEQTEARYRRVFRSAATGIVAVSPSGVIESANPAFCSMVGYSEDELCGRHTDEITHPGDFAVERESFKALQRGEIERYALEKRYVQKGGAELLVHVVVAAQHDVDGDIYGYVAIIEDLSARRQAESDLQRSQALLRIAGGMARVGGWEVRLADMRMFWSQEIYRILEYPLGYQPSMAESLAMYSEQWRLTIEKAIQACADRRQPFDLEVQVNTHSGKQLWVRAMGEAVTDTDGAVHAVRGAFMDLSPSKKAEDNARETAHRLESVLESISDAFFSLDEDWKFTYVNAEAEKLLERPRDTLLGRDIWSMLPQSVDSRFNEECRRAKRTGTPASFQEYFAPLDKWFSVKAFPFAGGLAVYCLDITARRASDQQLALLHTAVSRLNDIVLITEAEPFDEPGPRIVFVNDAFERRTGYSREEVLGKTPRILQGPKTSRAELDRIRAAMERWEPCRAQLVNYTKSGGEFSLELDLVPIANDAGWYTHWVAVERDITERLALEDQLRQSQRLEAVGQLTGGVAHDFNNLLTVILGNADLLAEDQSLDESQRLLAEMVSGAAQRGAELTQRLLAFARKQALEPSDVDVNSLVANMNSLLRRTLDEHVELEIVRGAGLWRALIDPTQLESALLNLCINARDAMQEHGGRLTIETANTKLDEDYAAQHPDVQAGQYVMLAVTDTGTGIPPEHLKRVFEPFFTTKEKSKGTGLGLAMVYGFVKQSGGHVSIYSELGHGTTVRLYLPRALGPQRALQQVPLPDAAEGGAERILVVEDDAMVRAYATGQLRTLGYEIIEAENGPAALQIIRERDDIDLLFTDIVMPGGMSGRQLYEEALRIRPQLPVLYTSGYAENALVHQGRLNPGVQLLSKPYRREVLTRAVRAALDGVRRSPATSES